MILTEAAARLREHANGTMSGDELRAMAREVYGKATDREVMRLLSDAGYMRIARSEGGRTDLDPAYLPRLRREYTGELRLDGVDLAQGPDVVSMEDGAARTYIAPRGAAMSLNHWLITQMTPVQEPQASA